ncbi:MAG: 1-deoxy-D-xylulose-5-phosphate reductoisomerase [Chloroflexi bacterium]|nr:MAG: 1-deoxy-D-xylulose-5-phosphate reductoisomerase [Chloroflexota bacterium]
MGSGVRRLVVLGSTGSIGRQTLDVVRWLDDRFSVVGLAGGRNLELLTQQIEEFRPKLVSCEGVGEGGSGIGPSRASGVQVAHPEELACHDEADLVVVATSGRAGLAPTLAAIRAGKQVALANKEVLVMAGGIIMAEAQQHGAQILPVDSEHSAIWQCLRGENGSKVARLVLTASGGPFFRCSPEEMATITPEQALRHPTWQMGKKVTIDSATLMNKGMEIIEAHWLFGLPLQQIDVVVHPGSVVHSMVEFADGSVKAQLSVPDMHLPIQYALTYPERLPTPQLPRIDWGRLDCLKFELPDLDRFPCLRLAREAGERGGTCPAVLCAADEVAVGRFLSGSIGFLDIPRLIEKTLDRHQRIDSPSLEDILTADAWARQYAEDWRTD